MSAQRFSIGKQFGWQNETYEVRRLLAEGLLNLINVRTGETCTVTFAQLVQALWANELHFGETDSTGQFVPAPAVLDWTDYPESTRAVAEYRLAIIRPLLDLSAAQRKTAIQAMVQAQQQTRQTNQRGLVTALSVASVYRWLRDYLHSGNDIRALIPDTRSRGGKQQPRLAAEAEAIVQATLADLYYVREEHSLDYFHREIAVRIQEENQRRPTPEQLETPSRATVARRITALDLEAKLTAKHGKAAAHRQLTQYAATEYPVIPLERVEIDHTRTDLIVVDDHDYLPLGRLTLTHCLDTATRYPLGYYLGFEPPSYLAVMACLYHAICPKANVRERYGTQHDWLAYGIPYTLVIDNGKEFIGRDLADACQLLGITLQQTPVKTPHFKAAVERMFGTLNTGLLHTLPGTTFSNPQQRGDYDSLAQACISVRDLDQLLHLFLLDIYTQDFHQGLQDIPAQRWTQMAQAGFFPRLPTSPTDLQVLLGRVAYRTIQPYGISLHSLHYNCPELVGLRTRRHRHDQPQVKVKYNPADLSEVHVYDSEAAQYLRVPAVAQEYAQGLSLWKHQVIHNFALNQQAEVDIVALGQAQRQIQAIVAESWQRTHSGTRSKMARWQAAPSLSSAAAPSPASVSEVPTDVAASPALDFDLALDLEQLAAAGWGVSYDLPDVLPGGFSHEP